MYQNESHFEQYRLILEQCWGEDVIGKIQQGVVDFEIMLSKVEYLNLILIYEFADTNDNCEIKMHATNVKFNIEEGVYEDYDSNKNGINSFANSEYVEEKTAQMIRVWIFRWNLNYTSNDARASPKGGSSYAQYQKFLQRVVDPSL